MERTVEDLTSQLFTSEEKLKEIQDENNATVEDLKARLEVAEQQHLEAKKESDHLVLMSQRNAEKLNDQNETYAYSVDRWFLDGKIYGSYLF